MLLSKGCHWSWGCATSSNRLYESEVIEEVFLFYELIYVNVEEVIDVFMSKLIFMFVCVKCLYCGADKIPCVNKHDIHLIT